MNTTKRANCLIEVNEGLDCSNFNTDDPYSFEIKPKQPDPSYWNAKLFTRKDIIRVLLAGAALSASLFVLFYPR